jgi:putative ABC transport system permease protein
VKLSSLISMAVGSVRRNAVRSVLTMLGVVIGVGSVVVMVAIGQGATKEVTAKVSRLGTNLIVITPGATRTGGVSGGAGSQMTLTMDDLESLQKEAQEISAITPVLVAPSRVVAGPNNWRTQALGVSADYLKIRSWEVQSGRYFDASEFQSRRKVAVLGLTVSQALFGEEDPVGRTVRVRELPVEVIGLLARKGPTVDGADQDDVILMPSTTVQTRMAGRNFLGQILVSAADPARVDAARRELSVILRENHRLSPKDPDDFTIKDQREMAELAQGTTRVMTLLLLVVASVSLVVGGIGIMNIMLVSVTERTREIGIRRALGARRRDVLAQFLVEAVVLSVLGGVLGALLGVGVTAALRELTGWAAEVTLSSILLAMGFSVGVGVLFGWWPARRAAALEPIEALRFQ